MGCVLFNSPHTSRSVLIIRWSKTEVIDENDCSENVLLSRSKTAQSWLRVAGCFVSFMQKKLKILVLGIPLASTKLLLFLCNGRVTHLAKSFVNQQLKLLRPESSFTKAFWRGIWGFSTVLTTMHQWQTNNNNREQMNKHNKYNI